VLGYAALIGLVAVVLEQYAHSDAVQEWVRRWDFSVGTRPPPAPASGLSSPESVTLPLPDMLVGAEGDPSDLADPRRAVRAARLTRDGLRALSTGDLGGALDAFERATTLDPRSASAWHGKGLALDRMGNTREAADAYREFLKLQNSGDDAEKARKRLWQLSPR
jgi:tetratricopeptide (TPR) repeat protein